MVTERNWDNIIKEAKTASGVDRAEQTEQRFDLQTTLQTVKESIFSITNTYADTKYADSPKGAAMVRILSGTFFDLVCKRLGRDGVNESEQVTESQQVMTGLQALKVKAESVKVNVAGKKYEDVKHIDNQLDFIRGLNDILVKIGVTDELKEEAVK